MICLPYRYFKIYAHFVWNFEWIIIRSPVCWLQVSRKLEYWVKCWWKYNAIICKPHKPIFYSQHNIKSISDFENDLENISWKIWAYFGFDGSDTSQLKQDNICHCLVNTMPVNIWEVKNPVAVFLVEEWCPIPVWCGILAA